MAIHWPSVIDRVPSIVVETVSGLLFIVGGVVALKLAIPHPLISLLVLANAGSLLYEWKLDAKGFSLKDVAEREVGILLGVGIAALFKFFG